MLKAVPRVFGDIYLTRAMNNLLLKPPKAQKCIDDCRRAIELDEHHADSHYVCGRAQVELGRYNEALQSLKQSLRLDPTTRTKEAAERLIKKIEDKAAVRD